MPWWFIWHTNQGKNIKEGVFHRTVLGNMCNFFQQEDATIMVAELSCGFEFWWMYLLMFWKKEKKNRI